MPKMKTLGSTERKLATTGEKLSHTEILYLFTIDQLRKVGFSGGHIALAHTQIKVALLREPESKAIFNELIVTLRPFASTEEKVRTLLHLEDMVNHISRVAIYIDSSPRGIKRDHIHFDDLYDYLNETYNCHNPAQYPINSGFYAGKILISEIPFDSQIVLRALIKLKCNYASVLDEDLTLDRDQKKVLGQFVTGIKKSIDEVVKLYALFPDKKDALKDLVQEIHRFCLHPTKDNQTLLSAQIKVLGGNGHRLKGMLGVAEVAICYPVLVTLTLGTGVFMLPDLLHSNIHRYTKKGATNYLDGRLQLASTLSKVSPKKSSKLKLLAGLSEKAHSFSVSANSSILFFEQQDRDSKFDISSSPSLSDIDENEIARPSST